MNKTDEKLYEEAEARVGFKRHLAFYVIINLFLWGVWYFTRADEGHYDGFWPIWATLGWGIGLASHYVGVYVKSDGAVEREFEKLKREREQNH
ncbi:MAG: 2TM domain-containing protein [Vicingaceae bacterium]